MLEKITLLNTGIVSHSALLAITEQVEPSLLITLLAIINTGLQIWLSYRREKKQKTDVKRNS